MGNRSIRKSIYLSVCLSIYLSIYGCTALCWALAAFQLLNPIHSRQDSLDGGSARHKDSTYTQNNTNRIKAHRHPCLKWDSKPRLQCSSGRRRFMPETARPLRSALLSLLFSVSTHALHRSHESSISGAFVPAKPHASSTELMNRFR
jgi:hypothetical protein